MSFKMYSKESITAPLSAMAKSGRFVHSYIITGEKGTGRKTSALYIAMLLMCDNGNACGECRQCRRILSGQHPDLIKVERKSGNVNYTVDVIREKVVRDSVISPGDCPRKVYLMYDCDGWTDACQDALLKVTEDPPDAAYFIFTAAGRSSFLSTLISRSMTLEVPEADRESCSEALRDRGSYSGEQIALAVKTFGGNIGRCIDFLEGDEELMKSAEAVTRAIDAVINRDEYSLAVILSSVASKRGQMRYTLEMLARAVRDAAVIRSGGSDIIGCTPDGSRKMAERFTAERMTQMYDAVCEASARCTKNCNAEAAAAVLAGKCC